MVSGDGDMAANVWGVVTHRGREPGTPEVMDGYGEVMGLFGLEL